jgi:inorganic pyrophosphatase
LKKVLPAGMEFPYDFGFIPGTTGEDGDFVDAMVLMDHYTYPGCLVECRLIGALLAEQTEKDGSTMRNDRFIMIPVKMKESNDIKNIKDLNKNMLDSIVSFFENYNRRENKVFTLLSIAESEEAHKVLREHLNA